MTLRSKVALILVAAIFALPAVATPLRIGEGADELKAEAKRIPGSTFMMDRRSPG